MKRNETLDELDPAGSEIVFAGSQTGTSAVIRAAEDFVDDGGTAEPMTGEVTGRGTAPCTHFLACEPRKSLSTTRALRTFLTYEPRKTLSTTGYCGPYDWRGYETRHSTVCSLPDLRAPEVFVDDKGTANPVARDRCATVGFKRWALTITVTKRAAGPRQARSRGKMLFGPLSDVLHS
ncbi:hypothetical protein K438DRAFT_1947271 [Mycena galopus ATCC 62051]|nr:hypothetical protein K438DRAFT_1947271 [Mycena galopus ATCC 62051]